MLGRLINKFRKRHCNLVLNDSGEDFERYCKAILCGTDIVDDELEKLVYEIGKNLMLTFGEPYSRKEVAQQIVDILEIIPRESDYES